MADLDWPGSDGELRDAMERAMAGFAEAARAVQPGQWDLATPCADWSVHDVVDHVVAGERFVVSVMSGATLAESVTASVGLNPDDADVIGQLTTAAAGALEAFAQPLDQVVQHPVGSISARLFLQYRIIDQLGHTWDVAQATGTSAQLDPLAVNLGVKIAQAERSTLERSKNFATRADDDVETGDPVTTLMRLMGRSS